MNCMPHNKIHGFEGRRTPLSLSHSIKEHKLVYSWSINGKSNMKFIVNQKGKQIASQTIIEHEETVDHGDITNTKLTALVAVRNNDDKAFVNNFLSTFMSQNHSRGCVVLQLVSTKLDPSKTLSFSFLYCEKRTFYFFFLRRKENIKLNMFLIHTKLQVFKFSPYKFLIHF